MQGGNTQLIPLGIGIIIGLFSFLILIELWPILVIGLGLFIIFKGQQSHRPAEERDECSLGNQTK